MDEDQDVQTHLALLAVGSGSGPHLRERQRAERWLLDHADRAYPALLALAIDGGAGSAAVELLARFGHADSVPVLAGYLQSQDGRGFAAARSLGRHPSGAALQVLLSGLKAGGDRAVLSAYGLGIRGDSAAGPDLRAASGSADAQVRYQAIQTGAALNCITADELAEFARSDPDADVRDLAGRLAAR